MLIIAWMGTYARHKILKRFRFAKQEIDNNYLKIQKQNSMKTLFYSLIALILPLIASTQEVKVYEEKIHIPTYLLGEAEKNPVFYTPQNYQGAQEHVYPYANLNKLTDQKENKEYNALILENEYVKICVLPELGGRIYTAIDKTNNYDYIYNNHVIKPSLIGMAGAWISGGVEWNIPHHHRVSTYLPVDYKLEENEDGSKTIWVGEYEKRHETRWAVGLTLQKGKSYLEVKIKYMNVTPEIQSLLIWANVAVSVNENYRVIFPPDVERAVFHSKVVFSDWPVSHQKYMGTDFTKGVDVSWWKNAPEPTSFFAYGSKMDFMAGYDYGKQAGIVLVGDHQTVPGKKFWNWGNNDIQRVWDKILTDTDGPYLELMMGAYSDNQPDYSWCNPYTTKEATMYYYPFQKMGSIKNANKDLAINLEVKDGKALIEIGSTADYKNLKVVLSNDKSSVLDKVFNVNPSNPFKTECLLSTSDSENLKLTVFSSQGKELISYQPAPKKNEPAPAVYTNPKEPKDIATVDELYLTGLRLEQFNNPEYNPLAYYQEALKRDSTDMLANTQLGVYYIKKYQYEKAEKYLRTTIKYTTAKFTKPKFAEPFYYLGVCLQKQGKYIEASDNFYKAAWSSEWESSAYFQISQIDALNGNFEKALENCTHSIASNSKNIDALSLNVMLLRRLEQYQKALLACKTLLDYDALNFTGLYENYLLSLKIKTGKNQTILLSELQTSLRDEPDNYLETANRYIYAGFYVDAANLLVLATQSPAKKVNSYPMVYYYLGYCYDLLNDSTNVTKSFSTAAGFGPEYCFPYGINSIKALQSAIKKAPSDAMAHLYLGNIFCDFYPEMALQEWEKAAGLNKNTAVIFRNLAFIQANIFDKMPEAIENINRAILLDPSDALYLDEADKYYAYSKTDLQKRVKLYADHIKTIQLSDATMSKWINLKIFEGKYDEALLILTKRHFHTTESFEGGVHVSWVDAHTLKGKKLLELNKFTKAIAEFNAAQEFPVNLEFARDPKIEIANYYLGLTYKQTGDKVKAKEFFEKAAAIENFDLPEIINNSALACRELGNKQKANEIYQKMIDKGNALLNEKPHAASYSESVDIRYREVRKVAKAFYLLALGNAGLGNSIKAADYLKKSVETDPGYLSPLVYR